MPTIDEARAESASPRALLVPFLWTAALLTLGRLALIFVIDHVAHGVELETAMWRWTRVFAATLGVGAACAALATVLLRLVRGSVRPVALALVSALFVWMLSGLNVDLPSRVPGTDNLRGKAAWVAIGAASVVLAFGLARALARERRNARPALAHALPTALLVVPAVAAALWPTPRVVVREVARSLLEEEGAFEVVRPGHVGEPKVGVITPVLHWRAEGGERPALMMPPGAEVRFRVTDEDGPVRLRTAAGVDLSNFERLFGRFDRLVFGFEVEVDGELAAEAEVAIEEGVDLERNEWRPLGAEEGLPLLPGSEVVLRTTVTSEPPNERVLQRPWRIGFADPVLVRRREWPRAMSSPERPNIVLILMDTQRRDRLGCYGYEKDVSPNVDRLAARGTLYEYASATSSWTWPSTTSVLSGLPAERHGVLDDDSCYLSRGVELVSEALQKEGYGTAAFSGSPLISPSKNFDQGFELYEAGGRDFRKSHAFVPDALEWMETYAGQRFFLYLHLVDPHDPHLPSPEAVERFGLPDPPADLPSKAFTGYTWALRKGRARTPSGDWVTERVVPEEHQRYLSDLYDACVWTGDQWVGAVLDKLEELGLEDETVVAYTSDHGEEFFEHGMLEHGHALYRELVEVPLILAGPGIPVGHRSDAIVSNRHLAPTLARIGGASLDGVTDAIDLARPLDLFEYPVQFSTNHGWWNNWYRTPLHGLREGRWILHWAPSAGPWDAPRPPQGGQLRLFDAEADPHESRDLAGAESERAAEMLERLKERILEQRDQRTSRAIGGGEATQGMLEGIGYAESGSDDDAQ